MISFLSPWFLAGVLAAALPVVLHLLGRRPALRVLFPAVRLLKKAPAQETRRRRLRELLLLALRVSAIALLALAFARPYLARPAIMSRPSAVVVAVDRSFSMSAPGQFDRAVALARTAISRAPAGVAVGLVAFDDAAELLVRPTVDRTAVLKALAGIQPGYGGTAYATALASAAEALGTRSGRIVVITDLQRGGWDRRDAAVPEGAEVSVEDTGGPPSNLAVTDLRRVDSGLAAFIRSTGAGRRTGRARLTVNGQPRGVMPFAVEAGSVQQVTFPGPVPATGEAMVEIDDPIGYAADNTAYALLDPAQPPALLAIIGQGDPSRGSFYLERALGVDNQQLFRLDSVPASRFPNGDARGMLDKYAAVFLLGTRGLTAGSVAALGDYVNRGGAVLITVDDQVEPRALDRLLEVRSTVTFQNVARDTSVGMLASDVRHPILESLDAAVLGGVRFERVARGLGSHGTTVARFADGSPALVEERHGSGRVLLFASDLSNRWNDLPLQPAFLPLVHEVSRYLTRDRRPVREFVVAAVPQGVVHRPGIISVTDDVSARLEPSVRGRVPTRIVVNVDVRESDVARMTPAEFGELIVRREGAAGAQALADRAQAEQQQALWRFAIALAIVALLAEGLLGKTVRA